MEHYETSKLRAWFNANQDSVRFIGIMSPTCGYCRIGHRTQRTLFEWLDGADLKGARVWAPWMKPDDEDAAEKQHKWFPDDRLVDAWDPTRAFGKAVARRLGMKAPAWDTYLVYAKGVTWSEDEDAPPEPTDWQHQLWAPWGVPQEKRLAPPDLWWLLLDLVGWGPNESTQTAERMVHDLATLPAAEADALRI